MHRADRVILNTHALRDDFIATHASQPSSKFTTIPNGYDPEFVSA